MHTNKHTQSSEVHDQDKYVADLERLISRRTEKMVEINELLKQENRERMYSEKRLKQRAEFQTLLTEIANHFICISANYIHEGFVQALEKLGHFTQADHTYVFRIISDETRDYAAYEWCAKGIEPHAKNFTLLAAGNIQWWKEQLIKNRVICYSDTDEIPSEAYEEKKYIKAKNIKSILVIPLVHQNRVLGFLGFESECKNIQWTEDTQELQKLCGNMFSNVIIRHEYEQKIIEQKKKSDRELADKTAAVAAVNEKLRSDITAREAVVHALEKSEQRFRNVVQNVREYIYSTEYSNGQIVATYHSPRCLDITGYSVEEYHSNQSLWLDMVYPGDRERVLAFIDELKKTQTSRTIEHRIIHKDGSVRWISNTCEIHTNKSGLISNEAGFIIDITKKKEAEEMGYMLQKKLKMLEKDMIQIQEQRQHELGSDLHDSLGQVLSGAVLKTQILRKKLHQKKITSVDAVESEIVLIQQLITNAVQETRRIAKGLFPLELRRSGLCESIRQFAAGISLTHGIQCRFRASIRKIIPINEFSVHLYRIIQEAVANALKHGKHGRILITLKQHGSTIFLRLINDSPWKINIKSGEYDADSVSEKTNSRQHGLGLRIMYYRTSLLSGKFFLQQYGNRFAAVECQVPITEKLWIESSPN